MARISRTYCERVYRTVRTEDTEANLYLFYRKGLDKDEEVLESFVGTWHPDEVEAYALERGLKYYNILNDEGRHTIQKLTIKSDALLKLHQNLNSQLRITLDIIEKRHNLRSIWKGDIHQYQENQFVNYQSMVPPSKSVFKSLLSFM